MRNQLALAAVLGLCTVAFGPLSASANDLGCGRCGPVYYSPNTVYYAPPTYSYAEPTVTIVPQVIVQPNYIIRRTYVVRPTRYVQEETTPCWLFCGDGLRIVNQGQYPSPEVAPDSGDEREEVNDYRLSTFGGNPEINRRYYRSQTRHDHVRRVSSYSQYNVRRSTVYSIHPHHRPQNQRHPQSWRR